MPNATEGTTEPDGATPQASHAEEDVMDLLAEHVPLSLLLDLATPGGPPSKDLLQAEGLPEQAWWEPR